MKHNLNFLTCLFVVFNFISCQTLSVTSLEPLQLNASQVQPLDSFGYSQADIQAKIKRVLNKPKSLAPITLGVYPGLLSDQLLPATTGVFEVSSFQTKSAKPPLWSHTHNIELDQNSFTVSLPNLIVSDQRYQISLLSTTDLSLTIKLSNAVLYKGEVQAHSIIPLQKLLLKPLQDLQIEIHSSNTGQLKLVLEKSEDAGAIIYKRKDQVRSATPSDQLFDPSVPNGLSHLRPHEGEKVISDDFKVTGVLVNGTDRMDFQSATLILDVDDTTILDAFCQRYNAEIIVQRDNRYLMRLDLSTSPISRLPELISVYNQGIESNIEKIAFASLEGMQTFAILLDAITHNADWYPLSVELNSLLETLQTNTANPLADWGVNDINLGLSWWLVDSKIQQQSVEKVWDYSLGTGVRAAVIDRGFTQSHPEIDRRWLVGNKEGINYHNNDGNLWKSNDGHTPDHGHKSVMTLAAEKDNKLKTVGSAPNAKVAPYYAYDAWAMETAVYNSVSAGVRVVNISIAQSDFTWLTYTALAIPGFGGIVFDRLWHINGNGFMDSIKLATQAGVTFVVSAGNGVQNKGVNYDAFIPVKHPDVIRVGAARPDWSKRVITSDRWPTPGKEALIVTDYSNFGDQMVWGPGDYIDVSDWKRPTQTNKYEGTRAASPFVAGVVALMVSRNPDLKPSCIRQILLDTSANHGLSIAKPSNNANYPSKLSPKFINALEAVKMAVQRNGSCQTISVTPKAAQTFGGIVMESDGQKKLLTWPSFVPGAAAADKEKTLVQSVSDEVWNQQLKKDEVVMLKGWTDIVAGESQISAQQLEILEATPLCAVAKCASASVKPAITAVSASSTASATSEFTLTLKGEWLLPDVRPTQGRKFRVEFHPVGGGSPVVLSYNLQADTPGQNIWNIDKVTKVDHSASEISFKVPAGSVPTGNYNLVFESPLIGKSAPFTGSSGGFQISSVGVGALMIPPGIPATEQIPQGQYAFEQIKLYGAPAWIQPNVRIPVDPNQFVGIRFNQPVQSLKVQVGPIEVPVVSLLQDFAAIGIPEELPAGIHDVILRSTQGTLTLAQAVEKVAEALPPVPEHSPPPSGNPGEYRLIHLFNVEGNDEARAYLNGQLVATAQAGEDIQIEIGEYSAYPLSQEQRNEIRFELENRGGGYTYGFSLCTSQGHCYYHDVQGKADEYNVHTPDGTEDTRTGVVYNQSMRINRFGRPMGRSDQPVWYKVFNLVPDYGYKLNAANLSQAFPASGVLGKEYTGMIPTPALAEVENAQGYSLQDGCKIYYETWNGFSVNFLNENVPNNQYLPKVYGLEIYRGIHLLSRQVMGDARRPDIGLESIPYNLSLLDQNFTSYPNIHPPYDVGWGNWWYCSQ